MRVPIELHCDEPLLPAAPNLEKLVRMAGLAGLVGRIDVLPDVHFKAKNFMPTGVALAMRGEVVPMFVGPENDAMTMAGTGLPASALDGPRLDRVFARLMARLAAFRRAEPGIDEAALWPILRRGAPAVAEAWGFSAADLDCMDDGGCGYAPGDEPEVAEIRAAFPGAHERPPKLPDFVPWHDVAAAGRHCLGVLDGGGHFLELNVVDAVLEPAHAAALGLEDGEVCVALHAGPGDVGLVAHKHYLPASEARIETMPADGEAGRRFRRAAGAAANFAFANRLFLLAAARDALVETLGEAPGFRLLSDVPHDRMEEVRGAEGPVFVHRKGVVRTLPASAFPPDHAFAATGRPFYFPSSLGEDAFILTRPDGEPDGLDFCSHGTGRSMSREEALAAFDDAAVEAEISARDVRLYRFGHPAFSAQAPAAHKDAAAVLALLQRFGLARPVARLRPLASLKV